MEMTFTAESKIHKQDLKKNRMLSIGKGDGPKK